VWAWPWYNILLNNSVFQCACCYVNLERCKRGISLIFRSTFVYFSVHEVTWIWRDVNLERCGRGIGLIFCPTVVYFSVHVVASIITSFFPFFMHVDVICWSDCDDSENESDEGAVPTRQTTFSQLWTLSRVFGNWGTTKSLRLEKNFWLFGVWLLWWT